MPPPRRATRDDVARLAGTSAAVVSYVINNGPRPVREDTRQRVLAAIAELNYEPNRLAQALRSSRSHLLGLILPNGTIPFFTELRSAVEGAAAQRGYLLLTGSTEFDETRERDLMEAFAGLRVEGLIVVAAAPGTGSGPAIMHVPVVYVHRAPLRASTTVVKVDNELVGYLATTHLLEHGHRSVAFIGADEPGPVRERRAGWRRAMREAGHTQLGRLQRTCGARRGSAQRVAQQWLADDRPPRAIFAATDEYAIGVLSAAQHEGRTVPGGLAVMGADGIYEGAYTVPRLSTVHMPTRHLAEVALSCLVDGASETQVIDLTDHVRLVPRDSCGCRPTAGAAD